MKVLNLSEKLRQFDPAKPESDTNNTLPDKVQLKEMVRRAGDMAEKMKQQFKHGKSRGKTTRLPELDPHFTWKQGFLYAITGYPQNGKSEMTNFLALLKAKFDGWKVLMYSPESSPIDELYDQLAHTLVGQSTDPKFKNQMSMRDYETAIDFLHHHFYVIDDDLLEDHNILPTPYNLRQIAMDLHADSKFELLIKDPWNTLVHDLSIRDDKYLQDELRQEKRIATKLQIHNVILVHPRGGIEKGKDGSLPVPTDDHIANGAMWRNKCDVIASVHRPNYHLDRTDRAALFASHKIKKQPLVGIPGEIHMLFNPRENRYYINGRCPLVTPGEQPPTLYQELSQFPASTFETESTKPIDAPF
ncbi:hypothetical protein C8N40_11188 [Pontibacter mucosus]|uniref:SF4 helicase domain-containing protein n=1 Tax=Pontibacter mucosus TaxID=1649266 RepID=A0A2T5YD51_9BACT|nr:hypothetical protein [Pontibacter mucosus]PTX14423.1 hypothetical protein C8N40_11188 [Pontibacter mucosus]